MKKIVLSIIIVVFLVLSLSAQEKALLSANTSFDKRDYVQAIKQYKKALRKSNSFGEQKKIAYKIALSYYKMNNYKESLNWFEDAEGGVEERKLYSIYSEALAIEGKYDEAIDLLQKISMFSDSSLIKQRIAGIEIIKMSSVNDSVEFVSSFAEVNSEYSDYGFAPFGNKYAVSSARRENNVSRLDGRTGQGTSNIYFTNFDKHSETWMDLKKIPGKFNTSDNEGSFNYDSLHQTAYWTRCSAKTDLCLIYLSHFNKFNKKWSKPQKADFQLPNYDYGHPFFSESENALYFTSNMKSGFGGKDIWKISLKSDGGWGVPVNLGNGINTNGDEAFPSIYGDTLLFFASNRHESLGRYDIFFSIKEGLKFKQATNIGYPINSAADDYALILDESGNKGWFCSDRKLESSDDIYKFNGFPIKILVKGKVLHELDKQAIKNSTITYTNTDGMSDSIVTNENGEFQLYLSAFNHYRIKASKTGFYSDYKTIDTRDKNILNTPPPQKTIWFYLSKTTYPCAISGFISNKETNRPMEGVKVEIYNDNGFSNWTYSNDYGSYSFDGLKPYTIYTLRTSKDGYFSESRVCNLPKVDEATVFNRSNGYDMDFQLLKIRVKSEILLSNIYYDFNKSSLRETSKVELDKLASMLRETPSVIVQISAHTDEIGADSYNMKLSAARAQSVVDYLIGKGIERSRLIAKGYGESQLLIKNAKTDEEHQANRRTTFKVLEIIGSQANEVISTEDDALNIDNDYSGETVNEDYPIYRVQIAVSSIEKNINTEFPDIISNMPSKEIFIDKTNTIYRYEVGDEYSFDGAKLLQKKLKNMGYKDCFIISRLNGKKIKVSEALKLEN